MSGNPMQGLLLGNVRSKALGVSAHVCASSASTVEKAAGARTPPKGMEHLEFNESSHRWQNPERSKKANAAGTAASDASLEGSNESAHESANDAQRAQGYGDHRGASHYHKIAAKAHRKAGEEPEAKLHDEAANSHALAGEESMTESQAYAHDRGHEAVEEGKKPAESEEPKKPEAKVESGEAKYRSAADDAEGYSNDAASASKGAGASKGSGARAAQSAEEAVSFAEQGNHSAAAAAHEHAAREHGHELGLIADGDSRENRGDHQRAQTAHLEAAEAHSQAAQRKEDYSPEESKKPKTPMNPREEANQRAYGPRVEEEGSGKPELRASVADQHQKPEAKKPGFGEPGFVDPNAKYKPPAGHPAYQHGRWEEPTAERPVGQFIHDEYEDKPEAKSKDIDVKSIVERVIKGV